MAFLIWLSRNSFCTFSRRSIFGFGRIFDAFIFAHFNSCNLIFRNVSFENSSREFNFWTEIFLLNFRRKISVVLSKIPRFTNDFRSNIRYKNFDGSKLQIIPVAILSRNPTWLLRKLKVLNNHDTLEQLW